MFIVIYSLKKNNIKTTLEYNQEMKKWNKQTKSTIQLDNDIYLVKLLFFI